MPARPRRDGSRGVVAQPYERPRARGKSNLETPSSRLPGAAADGRCALWQGDIENYAGALTIAASPAFIELLRPYQLDNPDLPRLRNHANQLLNQIRGELTLHEQLVVAPLTVAEPEPSHAPQSPGMTGSTAGHGTRSPMPAACSGRLRDQPRDANSRMDVGGD